jgi:tetratricopeptide (TPR) repeat protein
VVAIALALATTYQFESKQLTAAITNLFELANVHTKRNDVTGATQALETILAHEPTRREAYDQARTLYASAKQWSAWATLTSKFLPNLKGTERLTTLDELAERHEVSLIDQPGAFDWACQAVRLDPASGERRERVERLSRHLHREAQLAKLYQELLEGVPFSQAYVAISLTLASVEDEVLDRVDAAGKALIQLLEQDPGNADALLALGKMYERRGMHAKLASTLELELETAKTAAERAKLLERLAKLHEEQLKDPKGAANALQRLFELERTPERAGLLIALHQRHQQWPEAINMLLALRQLMPTPNERAKIQLQICELYESKLDDSEAAVAGYHQALELDPASPIAFRALERLYLELERPAELLRAYERRLVRVDEVAEKIELLYKSATLFEQRGGRVQADRCLVQITEAKPSELHALEELARLRRIDERWKPLTETLTRLVEVLDDAPRRAALCTELGHVFVHLRDPAVSLKWWNKALEYQLDHRPAIQALAQLHQQEGRWQEAAKYLDRDAVMEQEPAKRAELEFQSGVVKEERLRQVAPAKDSYRRALSADPVHLPSLRRLRALFLKAGEWKDYEGNLEHEATRAPQPADRFAAALELAHHNKARAHDSDNAIRWYEHALAQKPGALDAALPLADLLLAAKAWPRAVAVLQLCASGLEAEKPLRKAELVQRLCQLGDATRQIGKDKQALAEWDRALALEPMQPEALRGQFEVLDDTGKSAEAMVKLEQLLQAQPRAADRAHLHTRLGELYWQHGRAAEAQAAGERALSVEAGNIGALKLLVATCEEQSLFEKSVLYRQRLAGLLPEPERPGMLFELGVVAQEKLKKPARAIEAYVGSLALKPNEKRVLERLHVAYREAGHNRKAAETLQSLIELPELSVNERRGHTLSLAEQVAKGNELDRAAAILEKGLDRDPTFTEAFQTLEQLLTNAQQWAKLDGGFERMIARLGEQPPTSAARASLWRRVAELRKARLKDPAKALTALEQAARLLPNDVATQEAYGDLAIEFPNRVEDAVLAYQRALPLTTTPEKYRAAVARLAARRNDLDTALLAARASVMLGATPPAEKALLDKWAAQLSGPPQFRAPVSDQSWKEQLLHPDTRGPLGELMAFLYENAGAKYSADPSDFKLVPKKHTLDLRAASHPSLRQLALTGRALGFESLNVLSPWFAPQSSSKRSPHPDDQASFRIYPTFPFTLVVGERFFNEKDPAALAALIGSRLAYLRPELALSQWPSDQLWLTFEAALCLAQESRTSTADPKMLKNEIKRLSKALSNQARAELPQKVFRYLKVAKSDDLPRYFDGARQTPIRTALLVAADFAATARIFPEGEAAHGSLRQLLHFALGGELAALRKATGCALVAR